MALKSRFLNGCGVDISNEGSIKSRGVGAVAENRLEKS